MYLLIYFHLDLLRCDGSSLQVGDRIVCDENFGTVKYIGLVPPTKGIHVLFILKIGVFAGFVNCH